MHKKFVHITSVHTRRDTRIFLKQCRSLLNAGYGISLVVADGKGDEIKDGVKIFDVGSSKGRVDRMVKTTRRVFSKARELDADVYHLHDPELIPWGLALRFMGKSVIYDMHENLPKQVINKSWIPERVRSMLSASIKLLEKVVLNRFYVIMAESSYCKDYSWINNKQVILNYPLIDELIDLKTGYRDKPTIGYIGGVSKERGVLNTVSALKRIRQQGREVDFLCIGNVSKLVQNDPFFKEGINEGWIHSTGRLSPHIGWPMIAECHIGMALLLPIKNYFESYPTKMFEYMAMGIPVLVSDFPLYRDIVENNVCGICVDPLDPDAIAQAINFLMDHPEKAKEMGQNGQKAVQKTYNWHKEAEKLLSFYDRIKIK